jgi:membrane-associated phospholipid phosphatase
LVVFVSLLLTNFIAGILKFLLGRARPDLLFSQHLYGFSFFASSTLFKSFPSIHSSTIGVVCGAFACFYPRWSVPLLLLCLILAFSRVALSQHFVSDVIAGVTMGVLISQWVYKKMKKYSFQSLMR